MQKEVQLRTGKQLMGLTQMRRRRIKEPEITERNLVRRNSQKSHGDTANNPKKANLDDWLGEGAQLIPHFCQTWVLLALGMFSNCAPLGPEHPRGASGATRRTQSHQKYPMQGESPSLFPICIGRLCQQLGERILLICLCVREGSIITQFSRA